MRLSRGSRWFLASLVLLVAAGAGGLWWVDQNVLDDGIEPGQPVEYTVERGASVGSVGDDLAELGVVSSGFRFRTAAEQADLTDRLQPGLFELETGMSHQEAVEVLAAGPVAPPTIRFTVPEGLTVAQTLESLANQFEAHEVADFQAALDERLEASEAYLEAAAAAEADEGDEDAADELTRAERALDAALELPDWLPEPAEIDGPGIEPFEGVLWPQTYDIDDQAGPQQILQRMVDQLADEFAALPDEAVDELDDDERYELLILASLVERETRVDAERGMVAGVIANRLEEGMRLQIDATVVYALGGGPRDQVTFDDLEVDSPYNTYEIDGLPPTPISGVGTAALRAAAEPEDVPYRFYVLDAACDGTHRFAETGEQHQENVEAFRAADRCIGDLDGDVVGEDDE